MNFNSIKNKNLKSIKNETFDSNLNQEYFNSLNSNNNHISALQEKDKIQENFIKVQKPKRYSAQEKKPKKLRFSSSIQDYNHPNFNCEFIRSGEDNCIPKSSTNNFKKNLLNQNYLLKETKSDEDINFKSKINILSTKEQIPGEVILKKKSTNNIINRLKSKGFKAKNFNTESLEPKSHFSSKNPRHSQENSDFCRSMKNNEKSINSDKFENTKKSSCYFYNSPNNNQQKNKQSKAIIINQFNDTNNNVNSISNTGNSLSVTKNLISKKNEKQKFSINQFNKSNEELNLFNNLMNMKNKQKDLIESSIFDESHRPHRIEILINIDKQSKNNKNNNKANSTYENFENNKDNKKNEIARPG
jgi:hypothetical protein